MGTKLMRWSSIMLLLALLILPTNAQVSSMLTTLDANHLNPSTTFWGERALSIAFQAERDGDRLSRGTLAPDNLSWDGLTHVFTTEPQVQTNAQQTTDAPYMDASLDVEARVEDLLARMSLEEKIGQMTLVEIGSLANGDVANRYLGGVLSGGGGAPRINTPENWADRTNSLQEEALTTPLAIPIIYGVDAIHGHNNLYGAVIYPHNIGLGASHNPTLVTRIAQATTCDLVATGIYWNYAPVIAVTQDPRWGRFYEGYGQETDLVTEMGLAFMQGSQGDGLLVASTPKHFIGDGATVWGSSTTGDYEIDQGDMVMDEATIREVLLPPYQAVVDNGAMVIMTSFSSWNGVKMHAQSYWMNDVLKGELGFNGFIVSDWQAIDQITPNFYDAVVIAINAGIDMNMVPYNYNLFITTLTQAVENGDVSQERIDDAVRRILRVKFMLGLFENPLSNPALIEQIGGEEQRALGRAAVSQTAVLLQNNNDALPLDPNVSTIVVGGSGVDDIGVQSGGWTITWQGASGRITEGTTIRRAIEATVSPDTEVIYDRNANFRNFVDANGQPRRADVGIVVMSEPAYAEGMGDLGDLTLTGADANAVTKMRERVDTLIVILISGRPRLIEPILQQSDAFVMAWLPGTEGQGIADLLFGAHPFTATLSVAIPRTNDALTLSELQADPSAVLFNIGDGIVTGTAPELPELSCYATASER